MAYPWRNAWAEFVPLYGLRRRDPEGHLHDQRDRVVGRPLEAGRPGPGTLLQRHRRDQEPVLGDEESRRDRDRQGKMGDPVESGPERLITFDGRINPSSHWDASGQLH